MVKYISMRLLYAVPTLIAVLTVVFILVRIVPGDPAMVILGDSATPAALEAMRERLGLNKPLVEQYFEFLLKALRGGLGISLVSGKPVVSAVLTVLPFTLELTICGVLLGIVFGIPFGMLSAVYRNPHVDYLTRTVSLLGLSFPAFYSAILLILVFSLITSFH